MLCYCASQLEARTTFDPDEGEAVALWPSLRESISHEGTVLLSDELLYEFAPLHDSSFDENYQSFWRIMVSELRALGVGSIAVVLYLRNRADFAESWWRTQIVVGKPFGSYFDTLDTEHVNRLLDYRAHVAAIEQALGSSDRLIIRKYDFSSFVGGDIYHDFCHVTGIAWNDSFVIPEGKPNASLTNDYAEALRDFMQVAPRLSDAQIALRAYASRFGVEDKESNPALLPPEEYERRFARYKEGDRAIANSYFGEEELTLHSTTRGIWHTDDMVISSKANELWEVIDEFRKERYPVELLRISTPVYRSVKLDLKVPPELEVKAVFVKPETGEFGNLGQSLPFFVDRQESHQELRVSFGRKDVVPQAQWWTIILELEIPDGHEAPGIFTQQVFLSEEAKQVAREHNRHCKLPGGARLYPSWDKNDRLMFECKVE
ncbi:MAG: hypothetical protein IJ125_09000 [Atopobiaceae bacterium]|nr:hypothetical protein [Atopobiaceae bacterium]